MGKLRIERSDLHIVETLTGKRVILSDDCFQIESGDARVSVSESKTQGYLDVKGVRITFDLRIVDGNVEVDFS